MAAPYFYVVGATGGVGSALCRMIHQRSMGRLYMVGRDLSEMHKLNEQLGGAHVVVAEPTDASNPDQIAAAMQKAPDELKGLAYCVGSITLKPLKRCTHADFADAFTLNCVSAAFAVKEAQANLARNSGSVVLFSTVASQVGFANHAVVASAKGAVQGLTLSLAAELAPHIRVNCVAPSLSKTKMAKSMTSGKMGEAVASSHPMKRLGEPEDLARAALFLLDPENSWVTGQVLPVDGGRSSIA
ncbi:Tropinone reductase-like [Porphyridium purpureum]|uniref:Tropinone reductase-like n=1 Tax=Porphyridium purpureum TaxID=35688 RepID=A0A5J4Z6N5_PORPP|nr:Tropinone reductase-like [Porphyridium purpureum]|eukprot:POR1661..scf295_1